jgi:hypothetical protein
VSEADRAALRRGAAYALARWQHGGRLRRGLVWLIWPKLAATLDDALVAARRDGHR